ncbi:HAMP domain-containing sensor histidine kinase [Furfurilactobacillus rossiae]|uniref:Signal transduction histidine-protein kinase ArlS n=1 Tax=Furfurilactobacillus rossiae DSM 15814 TaxID=1114972 RepID=A0A0R1RKY1_9LACO|nr:HAMP domain-containing histidine kinase [Furfurilactobacillus rossiae]KRL57372.1 Signal transduction histidine kinase [Furfurilactobacillus rossiae DSM 15814]MCF6164883.1 HAMP domain-containing histidine kinase [Furfurilactobacillus rossiae]QLE61157.1 Two-component system histidine kinase [Furfurilactobacillus rossiae]QLE63899.1 Two-component system histidine kinase [Furfurilactobacillus rossiae]
MMTDKQTTKKRRRMSLKWKWALGTGTGVFVIFTIVLGLLFSSFTSVLLRQEKRRTTDAINVVTQRLNDNVKDLTSDDVEPVLRPRENPYLPHDPSKPDQQHNLYNDAIIRTLANDNLAVSVYDRSGSEIFASRVDPQPFESVSKRQLKLSHLNGHVVYVGRAPIYQHGTKRVVGYVQVTNQLNGYWRTYQRTGSILIVLLLIGLLAISVFGYILASYFLRPISDISATITKASEDPQSSTRVPESRRNDELSDLSELLNRMLDQMQRYIDQQQQFVGDVSHELRTPVAIIQGHMELLNRWGKDDPEVLNESIQASLAETKRMKSLVQEMLDLSRAEQVEIDFRNQVTDIKMVVNQVFNNFKMIHPDFTFSLDDDLRKPTYVSMFRDHLEQVLIILMDNAVKYSQTRKEVHVSLSEDGRNAQVSVQDFGEGIAPENMDRVFNRFYRVDKARSREKGGNGLGLSIAKRLVEGYNGHVSVESSLGHGSIFQISLHILTDQERHHLEELQATQEPSKPLDETLKDSNLLE